MQLEVQRLLKLDWGRSLVHFDESGMATAKAGPVSFLVYATSALRVFGVTVEAGRGRPKGLLGSGPSRVESMETDAEFG